MDKKTAGLLLRSGHRFSDNRPRTPNLIARWRSAIILAMLMTAVAGCSNCDNGVPSGIVCAGCTCTSKWYQIF